jgi:hypothetical protein
MLFLGCPLLLVSVMPLVIPVDLATEVRGWWVHLANMEKRL